VSNTTADIARSVIESAGSPSESTPTSPTATNAHEFPDAAVDELDQMLASDPTNQTRRIAAAMSTFHDPRPFVSTKQGMIRRQFNDDGNETRRAAREMIDLAAWAEGQEANPADKAALAAHGFAAGINKSTMDGTLPMGGSVFTPGTDEYNQSADAVIDAIIKHGRR
jgi:hypothetical protein